MSATSTSTVTSVAAVADPWALGHPSEPVGSPRRVAPRAVAAWALSLGVVAQFWAFGGRAWLPTLGAVAVAAGLEAALRVGRGRSLGLAVGRVLGFVALAAVGVALIGLAPGALLVAAVLVADAAVVGWAPLPSWPQRTGATAPLAVGALVAAQLSWYRTGSRPMVLGLLALAAVLVEAYARAPRAVAAVERAVEIAAKAVVAVLVGAVLLVVSLGVLYLPGAMARLVRAPREHRRFQRSSWEPVRTSVADDRRQAIRPFASTDPQVRAARTRRGLVVVAVGTALVVVVAQAVVDARRHPDDQVVSPIDGRTDPAPSSPGTAAGGTGSSTPTPPEKRQVFATELYGDYSILPAYQGVPWADELQRVQAERVVDGNQTSKIRNIRNGYRVTDPPPRCKGCPELTVWLTGGSAAFGDGQRDHHTIASDLVRLAAADGIRLHVENHSHDGYTIQMEAEWEIIPALRTETVPDLVVFYDGWNDLVAELAVMYLDVPPRPVLSALPTDLQAINDDTDAFLASDIGPDAGRAAADHYARIQEEVDRAAADAGTKAVYFLQADAFASRRQIESYELLTGLTADEMLASPLAAGLDTMAASLGSKVTDLRDLFADDPEPTFLGLVHQNERGALVVAKRIYAELRPQLHELAD